MTTFAGGVDGTADGVGTAAQFNQPYGITYDAGNLYVAEVDRCTIRRITVATAVVSTLAGTPGSCNYVDAVGAAARFRRPAAVSADGMGGLYIIDANATSVRHLDLSSLAVSTAAGADQTSGYTDGLGSNAQFLGPLGLWADHRAFLYIAATFNRTIRRMSTSPDRTVTTIAGANGYGTDDGPAADARLANPYGLIADGAQGLFVTDNGTHTIRRVYLPTGSVTTVAGMPMASGSSDGIGRAARFRNPAGVALDAAGNLYIADTYNYTIRRMARATDEVTTVAGTPGLSGASDGIGSAARFSGPTMLALESDMLYISDPPSSTIRRMVLSTSAVTVLAGEPNVGGATDGIGRAARFLQSMGLTTDGKGNLYVADQGNHTLRQINLTTGEVTTVAGMAGLSGTTDGIGPAARITSPRALALHRGALYFTESCLLRRLDLGTREVQSLVGVPLTFGLKLGRLPARLNTPTGITSAGEAGLHLVDVAENVVLALRGL